MKRLFLYKMLAVFALLVVTAGGLEAASYSYSTSVMQGFNFQKDEQDLVGHINSLKIGGVEIKSDLSVADPEDINGDRVMVVGVVGDMYWEGRPMDSINFTCQVSSNNKKTIQVMKHGSLKHTEVELDFTIYEYDRKAKEYYKAFHSNNRTLMALIEKSGGDLALNVDSDQNHEVGSPRNYTFSLGVVPQDDIENRIYTAGSTTQKVVKKWGIKIN